MPRSIQMLTDPMTAADRAAAKQEREAWATLEKRIAELEAALRPFADAVYNDNGDVTISGVDHEHYMRAKRLLST